MKLNKILLIFILFLSSIFLFSCGKNEKNVETVYINVIDGSGSGQYDIGTTVTATAILNDGETFGGWLIDGELISTSNPYFFVANKDLTLTAEILGRKPVYANFSITYNLDGGKASNPTIYNEGMDSFTLNNPTKDGYTFVGWIGDEISTPTKSVTIKKGSTGDKTFTAIWEEYVKPEKFETLKIGVFADVQLTSTNLGSTANAYISLVHHLEFCKEEDVDVLFMNGDIVNNAIEEYYILFEKALKQVYGSDESKYPEFVWNMGNHEWWDSGEHNTSNALELYYKYARVDSPNLVKKSNVAYSLNYDYKLPSYYKVINGVPFIVISGAVSDGSIPDALREEIEGWLDEILDLPYVKAGGAIFVAYHCALPELTYFGQNSGNYGSTVTEIFKNVPNAIVFTGDTHYPSGNERTINQKYFTTINIGSSSYSRMLTHSATSITDVYYNLEKSKSGSAKKSEIMVGESQYLYEYVETIMIASFNEDGSTTISRYLTNDASEGHESHIGLDWNIPLITSSDDFIYTNERFENKEWANLMYGADGLSWDDGEVVKFNVENSKMIVTFNDCINHNYCEHYLIEVTFDDGITSKYDFVSSYYKWDKESHFNHFVINNLPESTSYKVKVTAYDYFDNESLNYLYSESINEATYVGDPIDLAIIDTYTDISRKVNYDVYADGSHSSLEYYYKGQTAYNYGATLGRLYLATGNEANKYISCTDWSQAILIARVKNDNDFDIYLGPTIVTFKANGSEQWVCDCGREYQQVVKANSDWTLVAWNLSELFNIKDISNVSQIAIKALATESVRDLENGYSFHFYMDDLDVVNEDSIGPIEVKYYITSGEDSTIKLGQTYSGTEVDTISFDIYVVEDDACIYFMAGNWQTYLGYFAIYTTGLSSNYNGINCIMQDNGCYRLTLNIDEITKITNTNGSTPGFSDNIEFIYVRGGWTESDGYISNIEVITK